MDLCVLELRSIATMNVSYSIAMKICFHKIMMIKISRIFNCRQYFLMMIIFIRKSCRIYMNEYNVNDNKIYMSNITSLKIHDNRNYEKLYFN